MGRKAPKIAKGKNLVSEQEAIVIREKCLDYRIRGFSYTAISAHMSKQLQRPYSPSMAYNAVARALEDARKDYQDKATEVLQIELRRCNLMISALEPFCLPTDEIPSNINDLPEEEREAAIEKTFRPSLKAMDAMEKLLDRKARLMGFYRTDDTKVKEVLPWTDDEEKPNSDTASGDSPQASEGSPSP